MLLHKREYFLQVVWPLFPQLLFIFFFCCQLLCELTVNFLVDNCPHYKKSTDVSLFGSAKKSHGSQKEHSIWPVIKTRIYLTIKRNDHQQTQPFIFKDKCQNVGNYNCLRYCRASVSYHSEGLEGECCGGEGRYKHYMCSYFKCFPWKTKCINGK